MIAAITKGIAAILIPILVKAIADEIAKQMPVVIKAVVLAITETMGSIAVKAADSATDIIPGKLDDQMIDGFLNTVLGRLNK